MFSVLLLLLFILASVTGAGAAVREDGPDPVLARTSIPWSQLGAKAGADYQGDGLAVVQTAEGARLRCVFQRLEAEATPEGLWLTSTVPNAASDHFRVRAVAVGRAEAFGVRRQSAAATPLSFDGEQLEEIPFASESGVALGFPPQSTALPRTGTVEVADKLVRFVRPGLTEEYTVSLEGVRQDFIVLERPEGTGELMLRLAVSGARIAPTACGVELALENSGRKIAYSRLRATDATGKELPAWMEVPDKCEIRNPKSEIGPAVVVNDADAVYPVRIDPTFSDANWISMNPSIAGTDGRVAAAVVDTSGNLYIGGRFTVVGDVIANNIAKWDGSSWSALASGINGYVVDALAVSGSNVYAGGQFTTAGGVPAANIAKWNGTGWSALGLGMEGSVRALAVSGGDLYAGGWFTTVTNSDGVAVEVNGIAKWDGSSWSALGSGMDPNYPRVEALAVLGSNVYAGGNFTTAGGVAANNIAKWNGASWSALGSGIIKATWVTWGDAAVSALAVAGNSLYAGGSFTSAGGVAATNIAKWDGSRWSALGSGINGWAVLALAVSGSNLYAGGGFTTVTNSDGVAVEVNGIAKWDGSNWSALGSEGDFSGYVWSLAVSGSDLYAGGWLRTAGGIAAANIAKWDGSNWSALGSGLSGEFNALATSGSDLYAGGSFTAAGGIAVNHIAKWNGASWSALGSGVGVGDYPPVSALAVSGSDLYAGGGFTTAGGVAATYIAKWNGSSWSALGSGINGWSVYALAVSGSNLYAGGSFTTVTNSDGVAVEVNGIAKWDGSSWSALGSGMEGGASALAMSGSNLYAGGEFTTVTNSDGVAVEVNGIAKWDGSSWSALGSGMHGSVFGSEMKHGVYALAVSGTDLYAAGWFTTAGGITANHIAKWDGRSWSALGSGIDGVVMALAVSGSDLYAGGRFRTAGGIAANEIAKWDGSRWSALGSGVMSYRYITVGVRALAVSGHDLYAAGDFSTAGGKVSAYIARAYLLPLPELSVLRSGADVMVSWPSADTAGFVLEQAGTLAAPTSWVTNTASVTDDGTKKSLTLPAANPAQFFRLRRP